MSYVKPDITNSIIRANWLRAPPLALPGDKRCFVMIPLIDFFLSVAPPQIAAAIILTAIESV